MFQLAPSKADQSTLRYWARNRYKAHVNEVRWTNRCTTTIEPTSQARPQIRIRPIILTEEQRAAAIRATGSSPFLEVKFVPRSRRRAKSLTRKVKK